MDKDAYQAFVESGDLFDRETAARFRKLLAAGGTKDGMELYREFRGAEPSREPLMLARGLITPEELEAQKAEKEDEKVTTEANQKVKGAKIEGKRHRALPKKPIKK